MEAAPNISEEGGHCIECQPEVHAGLSTFMLTDRAI